jgi:hypothetical protein
VTTWKVVTYFLTPDEMMYIRYDYDAVNDVVWPDFHVVTGGVDSSILDRYDFSPDDEVVPLERNPDGTFHITICQGHSEWATYAGSQEEAQWVGCCRDKDAAETGTGYWNCIEGPDSLPVYPYDDYGIVGFLEGDFKDFEYWNHWEWRTDCPKCSCFCIHGDDEDDFQCIPRQLTMTVVPHEDNTYACPDIDNHSEILRRGILDTSVTPNVFYPRPHAMTWETTSQIDINGYEQKWSVSCSGNSLELDVNSPFLACWDWTNLEFISARSTCEPLYLVFSYMTVGDTQCETGTGTGLEYGVRANCCQLGACLPDEQASYDLIAAQKWEVIITH